MEAPASVKHGTTHTWIWTEAEIARLRCFVEERQGKRRAFAQNPSRKRQAPFLEAIS